MYMYIYMCAFHAGQSSAREARKVSTLIVNYTIYSLVSGERWRPRRVKDEGNIKPGKMSWAISPVFFQTPHLRSAGGSGSMLVPINSARPLLYPKFKFHFFFLLLRPQISAARARKRNDWWSVALLKIWIRSASVVMEWSQVFRYLRLDRMRPVFSYKT